MSVSSDLPLKNSGTTFLKRHRITILYLTAYLVIIVAVFWPSPPWDSNRLPSGFYKEYGFGDPPQMTWFLDWFTFALRHGLNIFHTNFIDYPTGVNLAGNTSVPLLGLLATPFTLTLGPVAAFNILLRLAFLLSASSMYVVLRTWSRSPAAFVGGLLYGFGPYMVTEGQIHLNLAFVPIPPLLVWCLYQLLVVKRRSPVRMGLLFGGLAAAQALIEPELLVMLGLTVEVGMVGYGVFNFRGLRSRIDHLAIAFLPAALVFFATTGYWIWSLLFGPGHVVGTVLQLGNLQQYRADLLGPITPTDQLFAPMKLQVVSMGYVGGNFTENLSYLSLPAVALVVIFASIWRKNRVVLVSALLALVGFIFSLGSSLNVNNHNTGMPLPGAILAHMPLLNNMIPARFGYVVMLFAVITLTIGADEFFRWMSSHGPPTVKIQAVEVSGVVAVVLTVLLSIPQLPFKSAAPPWPRGTVAMLNAIPKGSVVLTYPFTVPEFTEAMSWQASDGMRFRLIGGYATVQGEGNFGQQYPDLLQPAFVQEFLWQAQGTTSLVPFYPAPQRNVNQTKVFCTFVAKYGVGAIVYWKAGKYPGRVLRLFTQALGNPTNSIAGGAVRLWLLDSHSCR